MNQDVKVFHAPIPLNPIDYDIYVYECPRCGHQKGLVVSPNKIPEHTIECGNKGRLSKEACSCKMNIMTSYFQVRCPSTSDMVKVVYLTPNYRKALHCRREKPLQYEVIMGAVHNLRVVHAMDTMLEIA